MNIKILDWRESVPCSEISVTLVFLAKKETKLRYISINRLIRRSDYETLLVAHYDRSLGRINYARENHCVVVLPAKSLVSDCANRRNLDAQGEPPFNARCIVNSKFLTLIWIYIRGGGKLVFDPQEALRGYYILFKSNRLTKIQESLRVKCDC